MVRTEALFPAIRHFLKRESALATVSRVTPIICAMSSVGAAWLMTSLSSSPVHMVDPDRLCTAVFSCSHLLPDPSATLSTAAGLSSRQSCGCWESRSFLLRRRSRTWHPAHSQANTARNAIPLCFARIANAKIPRKRRPRIRSRTPRLRSIGAIENAGDNKTAMASVGVPSGSSALGGGRKGGNASEVSSSVLP